MIEKDINDISDALAALAKKYRDTPMAGRSNLQQAVPITFGYKCATYLAAFERHKERLKQLRERVLVFEFGGAAGTLSSLGKDGLRTQVELAKELEPQAAGDRLAHGARPHRRGRLLPRPRHRHLRQDRVRREADDADRGRGGVRAVPRGPRLVLHHAAEAQPDLVASTSPRRPAMVRTQVAALLNAMEQDHERATGQWEIEWIVLPEIFMLTAGCLAQTKFLMSGLQVNEKRMRENLDITKGLIVSEAVMMGLGPASRPPVRARPRLRHLPQGGGDRPSAGRPARRERGDRQAHEQGGARQAVRPGELPRPGRRDGRPRAGAAAKRPDRPLHRNHARAWRSKGFDAAPSMRFCSVPMCRRNP